MKNRGTPKNPKGQQRRPDQQQQPPPHAFDPAAQIPGGFVVSRLSEELRSLFEVNAQYQRLLAAIRKLATERVPYAELEKDLVAILNPPAPSAPTPPPA